MLTPVVSKQTHTFEFLDRSTLSYRNQLGLMVSLFYLNRISPPPIAVDLISQRLSGGLETRRCEFDSRSKQQFFHVPLAVLCKLRIIFMYVFENDSVLLLQKPVQQALSHCEDVSCATIELDSPVIPVYLVSGKAV